MLASEEHFKISTYLVLLNSTVSDLSPQIKAYCKVENNVHFSAQSSHSLEKAVIFYATDPQDFRTVWEELGEVEIFNENPCY